MRPVFVGLMATTLVGCTAPHDEIVRRPAVLAYAAPIYPQAARRYGVEGIVRVRFCVLADGSVEKVQVDESSGNVHLDAAAVDAMKRTKFRPAQAASGQSVDTSTTAPYRFVLEDPVANSDAVRSASSGPSTWVDQVIASVRKNIILTGPIDGNPLAEVDVWLDVDGRMLSKALVKASGSSVWDAAVLRALDKTRRLPVDSSGKVPPRLRLAFRPSA